MLFGVSPLSARTIAGHIYSDVDSAAVRGALCTLKGEMTDLKVVTDSVGAFLFDASSRSPLTLEVTMTGYSPTEIRIDGGNKDVALGRVFLNDAMTLGNVTVTTQGPVESRGRTIVYPSSSDVSASSTAVSLLGKLPLPGVEVNMLTRTFTVDGGTPVILINGVPSTMQDVQSLQAKNISRVEYSRVTPARYLDSGKSGLVSITLKQRTDGGSIYVYGRSALTTAMVDGNINASYHQGKSEFSLSYNPSWRNYQRVYDNTTESYIGDDFRVDLKQNDRNPFNYLTNMLNAKYNYSPSQRTLVSVTLRGNIDSDKSRRIGSVSDTQVGDYDVYNYRKSHSYSPSLDLYVRHDIDDHNKLEAEVVGTYLSGDYTRRNSYDFDKGGSDVYDVSVDTRRLSLISELVYTHTFRDGTELGGGLQNILSRNTNEYLTTDYKPRLTENNNYAYVQVSHTFGKVWTSLATGAKLFWVKNDMNKRNFVRNLSTLSVWWGINNSWALSASMQYTPIIPSLSALTDYMQQVTPYLYSNGNPSLKVAERFDYRLMPRYKYKKLTTTLMLMYRRTNNAVISDMSYLGNEHFLSQSVNSRYHERVGGTLSARVADVHGFGVNVNVSLYHEHSAGADWDHYLTTFSGGLMLWWQRGPFTVSYGRSLPGKSLWGNVVEKEENYDNLQVDYKPNKHWTVGLGWMFMFSKHGTQYPSWDYSKINPSYTDRYIKDNANMVMLSVSYSADFGSIFRTARRNLNNSDNGSALLKM